MDRLIEAFIAGRLVVRPITNSSVSVADMNSVAISRNAYMCFEVRGFSFQRRLRTALSTAMSDFCKAEVGKWIREVASCPPWKLIDGTRDQGPVTPPRTVRESHRRQIECTEHVTKVSQRCGKLVLHNYGKL